MIMYNILRCGVHTRMNTEYSPVTMKTKVSDAFLSPPCAPLPQDQLSNRNHPLQVLKQQKGGQINA